MFSALISFLGGSVFRMIWGEFSSWMTAKQEHSHEIERMRLQGDLDAAQHSRNLEAIKLQADLGVKTIEAQSVADLEKIESGAWASLVESTTKTTGIKLIDAWNQSIRPFLATIAIAMVMGEIVQHGFDLSDWDRELFGAILGIFVADRSLAKRGK